MDDVMLVQKETDLGVQVATVEFFPHRVEK